MNIGVPVGAFHQGNTSEYVVRAFAKLGHRAVLLTPAEFNKAFLQSAYDYYLCVDSGEPVNLLEPEIARGPFEQVGYWFIDYRHHKNSVARTPNDFVLAQYLSEHGGWVFQAQREDVDDCLRRGVSRCSWLPLAADPEIWSDQPGGPKSHDIGFVGNIWDEARAKAIETLLRHPQIKMAFRGHAGAWKEEGAKLLRSCKVGFNINSWFGESYAFDINMRVFETLSCGIPLITNTVPALAELFPAAAFIRTYSTLEEIVGVTQESLQDEIFLRSGSLGRKYILEHATYEMRMAGVLSQLTGRIF